MKVKELFTLKEDIGNLPQFRIWTAFDDETVPNRNVKQFKNSIEHFFARKYKIIDVSADKENLEVILELNQQDFKDLDHIIDIVRDLCEEYGRTDMGGEEFYCEWPPAFKLDIPLYTLNIQLVEKTSSKDFSKYIGEADIVVFDNTHYLTGVLGILALSKTVDSFELKNAEPILNQTEEVVKKYFYKDADILECQEELMSKGLKKYAKF